MIRLQEWIHRFEVGEGTRTVPWVLAILALLALTAVYDLREYRNFSTAEAMDAAQLARNLATGKGYTTDFIRPLSIHLVEQHQIKLNQRTNDFALLKSAHPDLANPPVYPLLLAGLMKALPFEWEIPGGVVFLRYQPEVLIAFFNQALFFAAILAAFQLCRRRFAEAAAWISTLALAGSELFWRVSVSGLSTMLLVVIFLGLGWCLVFMEQGWRGSRRSGALLAALGLPAGGMGGGGALSRCLVRALVVAVLR